jgi:hypothetical protein
VVFEPTEQPCHQKSFNKIHHRYWVDDILKMCKKQFILQSVMNVPQTKYILNLLQSPVISPKLTSPKLNNSIFVHGPHLTKLNKSFNMFSLGLVRYRLLVKWTVWMYVIYYMWLDFSVCLFYITLMWSFPCNLKGK